MTSPLDKVAKFSKPTSMPTFSVEGCLIIASGIFIVVLLSIAWAWDYSNEKISIDERRNDLEIIARNALDSLIKTEGDPGSWNELAEADFNENNVYSLGLVKNNFGQNVLDSDKIQKLVDLEATKYGTFKKILGILGPGYEFELKVSIWAGSSYSDTYTIGLTPIANTKNIVNIDRFVLLDGDFAKINIKVWENE